MDGNTINTLHRRVSLAKITSGAVSTLAPITHVAFGTGGTDGNGDPVPPLFDADNLASEIARYPIDSVIYPLDPPTTARYTCTIPPPDLPGATINEAAIVDADGNLCAIITFYIKRKDAGISFTFTFDDEFV